MTKSVSEAQLKKTDAGLIPQGEGWSVLNARDVSWIRSEERGQDSDFEGGPGVDPSSAFKSRWSPAPTQLEKLRATAAADVGRLVEIS